MVQIPKITIHIDLDNLDKINDEILLWELCRRHDAYQIGDRVKAVNVPIGPNNDAKIMMTEDAYNGLMGIKEIQ